MMVMSGLDESAYESFADVTIYGKLFPKILEDFVARADLKMALKNTNLPVTTNVSTIVNTAVQVAVPAGTGTGVGKGSGSGQGQVAPIYVGDIPSPEAKLLEQRRRAEKEAGVAGIEGLTSGVESVANS